MEFKAVKEDQYLTTTVYFASALGLILLGSLLHLPASLLAWLIGIMVNITKGNNPREGTERRSRHRPDGFLAKLEIAWDRLYYSRAGGK